jgi:hypothetical protein
MEVNINMGLQKITFDGANVTSKIDADLYHFLFSKSIGILEGLKNSVQYSLSNKTIVFQDGYISIYGRIIYVENGTSVNILTDSSKYGYVVLGVNTIDNTLSLYTKEQTGSYPTLVTTDLTAVDGLYEFALCAYTKTSTSVTLISNFTRPIIQIQQKMINDIKKEVISDLSYKKLSVSLVQSGVYKAGVTSSELSSGLLVVIIGYNNTLAIPGALFFLNYSSSKTVNYQYGGAFYSLQISYSDSSITLTCGNTSHRVTSLFLYK